MAWSNTWIRRPIGLIVIFAAFGIQFANIAECQTPSHFSNDSIGPWAVHIGDKVGAADPEMPRAIMDVLRVQIYNLVAWSRVLPMSKLQDVSIWIDQDDSLLSGGSAYVDSVEWLMRHNLPRGMNKSILISNARNYLQSYLASPQQLFRLMAMAYYYRYLEGRAPRLAAAYRNILQTRKYDSVLEMSGHYVKGWSMRSEAEYFSEQSVAWFGVNSAYPFVQAELREFDPEMCRIVSDAWFDIDKLTGRK